MADSTQVYRVRNSDWTVTADSLHEAARKFGLQRARWSWGKASFVRRVDCITFHNERSATFKVNIARYEADPGWDFDYAIEQIEYGVSKADVSQLTQEGWSNGNT